MDVLSFCNYLEIHMAEFIERRLLQLEPIGPTVGVSSVTDPIHTWVSKVKLAGVVWTRCHNKEKNITKHYEGDLPLFEAEEKFRKEID